MLKALSMVLDGVGDFGPRNHQHAEGGEMIL